MSTQIPTADQVHHFAVYGTLRDDCDELSKQDWTAKFVQDMSAQPRTACVYGMKLLYTRNLVENWPYAMESSDDNDCVVVRLLEFKPNWTEKLIEADGVEQYDPNAPDSSPLGYKRRVVAAHVIDSNGNKTDEVVYAVMYFISDFDSKYTYHKIPSGDWLQRDLTYYQDNNTQQPTMLTQQEELNAVV